MSAFNSPNEKTYNESYVIRYYAKLSGLTVQEQAVLNLIYPDIQGGNLLDVGIGAGRTTPELKTITDRYVGIDYSQGMVDHCKARFPEEDIFLCDARRMDRFGDGEFHLVFFSFNGIDNVQHGDRIRILKEIHRVVAPRGYFVFSSHNRSAIARQGLSGNGSRLKDKFLAAATLAKGVIASPRLSNPAVKQCIHRCRLKWREVRTEEYALLNDPGHDYSTLQYYITARHQREQLREAGFEEPALVFDAQGGIVENCGESPWLYYCVRK